MGGGESHPEQFLDKSTFTSGFTVQQECEYCQTCASGSCSSITKHVRMASLARHSKETRGKRGVCSRIMKIQYSTSQKVLRSDTFMRDSLACSMRWLMMHFQGSNRSDSHGSCFLSLFKRQKYSQRYIQQRPPSLS